MTTAAAQKTHVVLGTATPGGGFPLFGGAAADTINETDPKIEAVQRLYAAVFANDMDAILAELADDVDWAAEAASSSVPWYGNYRGKGQVPGFFARAVT